MANENGEWIMHGVSDRNPSCIKTMDKMIDYVDQVGFLPQKGLPLYVTEGANHSLETGDVDADISELAKIMYICEEYMM